MISTYTKNIQKFSPTHIFGTLTLDIFDGLGLRWLHCGEAGPMAG